jgi:TM2 domain-containing membrane protein YozV
MPGITPGMTQSMRPASPLLRSKKLMKIADMTNLPPPLEPGALQPNQQYCRSCGRPISNLALACPFCGAPTRDRPTNASDKSRLAALLLCFFVGIFGIHRFYVGKVGTGILELLTIGGLGIWTFIDFILIALGEFKDKQGKKVLIWMNDT